MTVQQAYEKLLTNIGSSFETGATWIGDEIKQLLLMERQRAVIAVKNSLPQPEWDDDGSSIDLSQLAIEQAASAVEDGSEYGEHLGLYSKFE